MYINQIKNISTPEHIHSSNYQYTNKYLLQSKTILPKISLHFKPRTIVVYTNKFLSLPSGSTRLAKARQAFLTTLAFLQWVSMALISRATHSKSPMKSKFLSERDVSKSKKVHVNDNRLKMLNLWYNHYHQLWWNTKRWFEGIQRHNQTKAFKISFKTESCIGVFYLMRHESL